MSATAMPLPEAGEGDAFAGFELREKLGEGGVGRVFRAERAGHGEVALKIVRREVARDETFRRRFRREVETARSFDDPHVVSVLADGEENGIPFLAFELMRGGSLQAMIDAGPLELGSAIAVCGDIAAGLEAIHARGIVHRDVKPANVLLDADGRAEIADLGLVKLRNASVLTRQGAAVGSWHYMAPEQIRGEKVGPTADVYSLGCVAYACLTGAPPFADRQGMRVMWAHLQEDPPNATTAAGISPELGWALQRAMAKIPAERPPSAAALASMLRMAAGHVPGADG